MIYILKKNYCNNDVVTKSNIFIFFNILFEEGQDTINMFNCLAKSFSIMGMCSFVTGWIDWRYSTASSRYLKKNIYFFAIVHWETEAVIPRITISVLVLRQYLLCTGLANNRSERPIFDSSYCCSLNCDVAWLTNRSDQLHKKCG